MSWTRLALICVGTIASILVVMVTVLLTVDFGRFKNSIEGYASDFLGRTVSIDGELSITFGAVTQIIVNDVRVAGTTWSAEPDLLTLGHLAVSIDTLSALTDVVIVKDLQVDGLRAYLALNSDGLDNYSLPVLESEGESDPTTTRVFLTQGKVTELDIVYDAPEFSPPLTFHASSIELNQRTDNHLQLALAGVLNETEVAIRGSIGTMDDLMEAADVQFELSAAIGEISIDGSGLIDDLTDPRRPEVRVRIEGPSAEYLTDILGLDPVTTGPLSFDAGTAPGDDVLNVTVTGAYGEFDIDLAATVPGVQSFNDFDLTLQATGPNLARLGYLVGQEHFPPLAYTLEVDANRVGSTMTVERLFFGAGDGTLQVEAGMPSFPSFDGATASLSLQGPRFEDFIRMFGLSGNLTGSFEITADLTQANGRSTLDANLDADAIQGSLTADISDQPDLTGTTATLDIRGGNLSAIGTALSIEGLPDSSYAARANVEMIGTGVQINSGSFSVAVDTIVFSGTVGRDPLSTLTRMMFSSTLNDLPATLARFGIEPEFLPIDVLSIAGEVSRGSNAFTLDTLVLETPDAQLKVQGRIADTFRLEDMSFDLELSGARLAALLPPEIDSVPEGAFRATAGIGVDGDTIKLNDVRVQLAEATVNLDFSTSLSTPLESGAIRIEAYGDSIVKLLPMAAGYLQQDRTFSTRGSAEWHEDYLTLTDFVAQAGQANLAANGTIAIPPTEGDSELTLDTRLDSVRNLQFLTKATLPDMPLVLRGSLTGNPDRLTVFLQEFALDRTDLTGTIVLEPGTEERPVPDIAVNLRSKLIDLVSLQEFAGPPDEPAAPGEQSESNRVIPDTAIPNDLIPTVRARIDVQAEHLMVSSYDLTDMQLLGSIENGALHIEHFGLTGESGTLDGSLQLTPSESGLDTRLHINGTDLILGLPAKTQEEKQMLPRYEVAVRLTSSGATSREHASSTTGYVKIVSGEGQLDLAAVGFLTRDFTTEVFNTVNPFAEKEVYSTVRCMAVLVEAADGVVFGDPALVFQTDKLNIASVVRVDLSTEKLNATISTRARSGLGISMSDIVSPYTELGGTLASPHLQLNSQSAMFRGSATIATGGLSILIRKAGERLLGDKNPCQSAILEAEEDVRTRLQHF